MQAPKKLNKRTCANCEVMFQKERPLQNCCSPKCAYDRSKKLIQKRIDKIEKEEIKEMREKLKGLPEFKKDLEVEINTICRLIDKGQSCISCDSKGNSAGHFHSVNSNGSLRYNLHNLHLQEYSCNGEKGGNVIKYGAGLISVYGKEYKEYVEYDLVRLYPTLRLSIEEIKAHIKIAREIKKELQKLDMEYAPIFRIKLRTMYNQRIGIYDK